MVDSANLKIERLTSLLGYVMRTFSRTFVLRNSVGKDVSAELEGKYVI